MRNKFIIFLTILISAFMVLFLLYGLLSKYNVSLAETQGIVIITLCCIAVALLSNKNK